MWVILPIGHGGVPERPPSERRPAYEGSGVRRTTVKVLVAVAMAGALVAPGSVAPASGAPNNNNSKEAARRGDDHRRDAP
jgi:hypothetical protein